jgi:release factor glutamine methyltransferase
MGVGVDISDGALATATRNMAALGLGARAEILHSAWTDALDKAAPPFDIIISNPPYIALDEMPTLAADVRTFDPAAALTDGADGLSAYRAILQQIPQFLAPNGLVVLELGQGQAAAVEALAATQNLSVLELRPDYNGIDRALLLQRT